MTITFTEASYENSIIELFQGMGYNHIYGPDVERDYTSPLYEEVLVDSLYRINPQLLYKRMMFLWIICKTVLRLGI